MGNIYLTIILPQNNTLIQKIVVKVYLKILMSTQNSALNYLRWMEQ